MKDFVLTILSCQNLQDEDSDLTYAGCSLEAILNQTMHQLGYQWSYSSEFPTHTTQGWQASVRVHKIAEDPETAPP